MCVACVAAASPEVAVALGGFAAVRFGRPLQRLRDRRRPAQAAAQAEPPAVVDGTHAQQVER